MPFFSDRSAPLDAVDQSEPEIPAGILAGPQFPVRTFHWAIQQDKLIHPPEE